MKIAYRLLFKALLDIRNAAHLGHASVAVQLADLFHNVVLQLEADVPEKDVLEYIKRRAKEMGVEKWVDDTLKFLGEES